MTTVVWHTYHPTAPPKGYWSYGMMERLFADLPQTDNIYDVNTEEPIILVVPAEYNVNFVDRLNEDILRFDWVTLILASDENGFFPVEQLVPVDQLWVLMPHFEKHTYPEGTQFMGIGAPPQSFDYLSRLFHYEPLHDCSFSGQITHQRRQELAQAFEGTDWYINKTAGFTQGLPHGDYYRLIADTKVTPAPTGPVTFDSFRVYETLEAGNVPILDDVCPIDPNGGPVFWNAVFGEGHPLPHTTAWTVELQPTVQDIVDNWPTSRNLVYSWWQQHKRELRYRILSPIPDFDFGPVTVLIPTSPVPSNPDTSIIEETIASVKHHLPNADIIVMCDGVRPEQEHRREAYEQYVSKLCWLTNFHWQNVTPVVFGGHEHQANMTRVGLDFVRTPFVLFVEHDTPLVTDLDIDWHGAYSLLTTEVDVVRFHHEAHVHPEHEHMMLDSETQLHGDFPYRRTVQWSQRPHVAGTNYYRRIIHDHFPPTGRTMIEDKMHSVAQSWPDEHRIAIYHPDTGNIKRSYHLDGRGDDPKYEMIYE